MNNLPRDKQIEIIAALCEGVGQRAVARLTDTDRKTVARLALRVGRGCAELHDRMMVGLRVHRIECDELWAHVGHKRDFIQDLRQRVIGVPEISTDGLHYYKTAIRDAFGKRTTHGVIQKTYGVTHLNVTEASRRFSPAQVIAVERQAVMGEPEQIPTSYVERQNLSLRMGSKRFARLSNDISKKIDCHLAAVSLYVAFYNLRRTHEALRSTPAMVLGIADKVWTIGDLIDASLATQPITPETTAPDRRKRFRVIEGGQQ
jgi:IS1 family transposase